MEMNNLNKRKKIKFIRYNSEYLKKLSPNWRRAKGMHNKVRLKRKGHNKSPSIGYGTSKEFKAFFKSKFDYVLIKSEKDLENLNKKEIMFSKKLGLKKRLKLINKIKLMNLGVLNIKNLDEYIKTTEEKLKQKKEKKKLIKQDIKKKMDEKTIEKKELNQEEKLEKEKLEKRKVLEKGIWN